MNYTPTTEQVRYGYSIVDGGLNDPWIRGDAENRFDRWLAEVKAQEREHVIKKLAAHALDRTILMAIVDLIEGGRTVSNVVHQCPPDGSNIMPCCGKTPYEVPPSDGMALRHYESLGRTPPNCQGEAQ